MNVKQLLLTLRRSPSACLIAGPTVGGVVDPAVIAILLFWRYRHHKNAPKEQEFESPRDQRAEAAFTLRSHHLWASNSPAQEIIELPDSHDPVEIGGSRAILPRPS